MTHLELENLASEYVEGRLDVAARVEVEAHLTECEPCRETVADVRRAMELCQLAESMEPAPWLIPKILLATMGERKPSLSERVAAFFRPQGRMRLAYTFAMAVFSLSIIVNAAGLNLRHLAIEDFNPLTWVNRADSSAHLMLARAEWFYSNLRVVYEVESRLRQLRQNSGESTGGREREAPKTNSPGGGATDSQPPAVPVLAAVQGLIEAQAEVSENAPSLAKGGRGSLR